MFFFHPLLLFLYLFFFFFNDTATTEIYTLSLHDARPISLRAAGTPWLSITQAAWSVIRRAACISARSEEHTSELQSRENLVCRLLLEKKKKNKISYLFLKKKKTITHT